MPTRNGYGEHIHDQSLPHAPVHPHPTVPSPGPWLQDSSADVKQKSTTPEPTAKSKFSASAGCDEIVYVCPMHTLHFYYTAAASPACLRCAHAFICPQTHTGKVSLLHSALPVLAGPWLSFEPSTALDTDRSAMMTLKRSNRY